MCVDRRLDLVEIAETKGKPGGLVRTWRVLIVRARAGNSTTWQVVALSGDSLQALVAGN